MLPEPEIIDIIQALQSAFADDASCKWIEQQAVNGAIGTTFGSSPAFVGVLTVSNRNSIPKLLHLANTLGFHVLPVSSNQNWGYGCIQNHSYTKPIVLLDLSAMKKITATSKSLGLITLEPGVTQRDLRDYLDQNQWDYMVPVTGAGPNCSIVSNALERGYGITPHTDHFAACNALKAFVPHPDMCQTEYQSAVSGQDQSGEDFIDKTFKWGVGPYLDGIFTQSNMAVVSEMTFRLAPNPEGFCAFYVQVFNADKFSSCVHFINRILADYPQAIGSINLMDRRRLLSMTVTNPNLHKDTDTYLSDQQIEELAKQNRTPHWLIVGSIYASQPIVKAIKSDIKKRTGSLGTTLFSDSFLLSFAKWFLSMPFARLPLLNKMRNQLDTLDEGIDIMLGKPNQVALPLAYWRNRSVRPDKNKTLHPAKDGCGLLWYAPLVKMDADALSEFVKFVRKTIQEFDLDPFITFTNLRHDCIDSTVPIVFNLADENETQRAKKCLSALIERGQQRGFVPYRLPVEEQPKIIDDSTYWQCVKAIKDALDPNSVLSPGRYNTQ